MSADENMLRPGEYFVDQRKNAEKSAFGEERCVGDTAIKGGGLTKREYAAIHIMAGFAASNTAGCVGANDYAVELADQLMIALEKSDGQD